MFEDFKPYDDCEPAGLELPKIEVEAKVLDKLGLDNSASSFDVMRGLALEGAKERGIENLPNKQEYYDRVKTELQIFEELGFTDYILLNWDVINFARKNKVPIGDGRGSAAGSLVLYLLRVTNIDQIKYGLYFERFVSPSRAKKITDKHGKTFLVGALAPDVDTDIAHSHRPLVIDYIEEKHKGRTSKILTYNTFSSKLCIREAAKYFGEVDEEEANRISDMVPKEHGKVLSLERAYEESDKFKEWVDENRKIFDHALVIENLHKNNGVHPSGIAICSQDIRKVMPLQLTKDGSLVSGYDMDDVADLMVKFDILGLRTLSIAYLACEKIGVDFDDIDPEDPFIYQQLQDYKHPAGLFQISAHTNCEVAQAIKPLNLFELYDVVALARPAALQFVSDYKKQKVTPEKLGMNDALDDILATTKNVMLYQEQVMRSCHEVFGMSLDDAENLRRAIGKKKVDEIPKWQGKIFDAADAAGIHHEVPNYFWNVVENSAAYQFNLSHSICYASLAAKTVWLKYKHTSEFFCSILEIAEHEQEPLEVVAEVTRELHDFGINLLPPQLDKSEMDFTIEDGNIRYGLKSIKGISTSTQDALGDFVKTKRDNKFDVFRSAKQCGINIGVLSSLIYAGALGSDFRLLTALEAQTFNILTDREKMNFEAFGKEFNYKLLDVIAKTRHRIGKGDVTKQIMADKRFENVFKRDYTKYKELYEANKKFEKLAIWWFEKKLLGYAYTYKLRECFDGQLDPISAVGGSNSWRVIGHVDDFFIKKSVKGNRYIRFTISDEETQKTMMFCDSPRAQKFSDWEEESGGMSKSDIVIVRGNDEWVNSIDIMGERVYLKVRDLK